MANYGADVVAALVDGDNTAWKDLIGRLSGPFLGYARRKGLSDEDSEEAVQDAFVAAWHAIRHNAPQILHDGYFWACLRTAIIKRLCQKRGAPSVPTHVLEPILNCLNDSHRKVLELLFGFNQTHSHIATRMELPAKQVKETEIAALESLAYQIWRHREQAQNVLPHDDEHGQAAEQRAVLEKLVESLSGKQRDILDRCFRLGQTSETIAAEMDSTTEGIIREKNNAFRRLARTIWPPPQTIALGRPDAMPDGDDGIRAVDRRDLLEKMFERLTPDEREVLARYFLRGETHKAIAAAMKLTEDSVRYLKDGAFKKLARQPEELVRQFTEPLNDQEREVFLRFYRDDEAIGDIACAMGLKEVDVSKLKADGLRKLMDWPEHLGQNDDPGLD